ncbi:transcription factor MYB23-like [Tripterygium wilfordii]|uniref:Transcription factor MYB23-like n=2 Tax=Tripterygium wilfordii TaxID=458696 RepID=A0A7J7DRR5_TRIWF|nr:transcription factor MYB23-like [Tripterygium wilfordii]
MKLSCQDLFNYSRFGLESSSTRDRIFTASSPSNSPAASWSFATTLDNSSSSMSRFADRFSINYMNSSGYGSAYWTPNSSDFGISNCRRINVPGPFGYFKLDDQEFENGGGMMKKKRLMTNNSSTLANMMKVSNQEKQGEESTKHADVPFIDFLGVGISS